MACRPLAIDRDDRARILCSDGRIVGSQERWPSDSTRIQRRLRSRITAPPPEVVDSDDEGDSMTITGGTLKDELLLLVESNPEVAANVIRGWVGEAA